MAIFNSYVKLPEGIYPAKKMDFTNRLNHEKNKVTPPATALLCFHLFIRCFFMRRMTLTAFSCFAHLLTSD